MRGDAGDSAGPPVRERGGRVVSGENEEARRDAPPFAFEDVWPEDEPLPLTDAECARLVRGWLYARRD